MKLRGSRNDSTESNRSAEIQSDRVWAVRFAKIHKGLLRRRWMQTEETIGAALDGDDVEDEEVQEVLRHEGFQDVELVRLPVTETGDDLVVVIGDF